MEKLIHFFYFLPKSKVKASEGLEKGQFPFFTSSERQTKFFDKSNHRPPAIIFGTGGRANLHLAKTSFSMSTDCLAISPIDQSKVYTDFVFYYLKSNMFLLEKGFKGAGLKHISKEYLSNLSIPFFYIDDQKRIAFLLGNIESLIAKRKQHMQELDTLLKSIFVEMFGDPVKNEMGWGLKTISNLVDEVKYGTSASAKGGALKYLRMNNITYDGYWDFDNLKYISIGAKDLDKYSLQRGDLVFNRTNSKELVGKTAVYNSDEGVVIAGYLIRVRVNEQNNPWYIWGYLNSKYGKIKLASLCRNIVGMANINAQELKAIPIAAPPLDLQNQFAAIVEKVERIKLLYQNSLTELENLYGALSQKAFKGELDLSKVPLPPEEPFMVEELPVAEETYSFTTKPLQSPSPQFSIADIWSLQDLPVHRQEDDPPVVYAAEQDILTMLQQVNKPQPFEFLVTELQKRGTVTKKTAQELIECLHNLLQTGKLEQVFDTETRSLRMKVAK